MKSRNIIILALSLFYLAVSSCLYAQEMNPRVIEVENIIKDRVVEYVQNILPNSHFLVSVKVTPLRRNKTGYSMKGEILPYFDTVTEEVRDEWDDPTVSIFRLFKRIASSEIKIIFTSDLQLKSQQQFISDLMSYAHLVPMRDKVYIEMRPNLVASTDEFTFLGHKDLKYLIFLFVFLLGLGGIAKFILKGGESKRDSTGVTPTASAPAVNLGSSVASRTMSNTEQSSGALSGDLSLTDPTKTMEVIRVKIDDIVGSGTFPTLRDMVELERLALEQASSFSALVYEFPLTHQELLFQYGKGELWYKCFTEVGQIDRKVLTTLDKMLRERTIKGSELFEKLLIQAWRLGDELYDFLENIDKEYAYSILYYLPKNISIPIGRKLFAGSWGDLVRATKIPPINDSAILQELIYDAYEIKPLLSYQSLEAYKNSRDLLEYLTFAGVKEEEDIYSVVGKQSDIYRLRPPFFKFFTLDDKLRQEVFESFSLQDWALAIFDTERHYRKIIDRLLDDKQKYLLSTFLREFDTNAPDLVARGHIREAIGRMTYQVKQKAKREQELAEELAQAEEQKIKEEQSSDGQVA